MNGVAYEPYAWVASLGDGKCAGYLAPIRGRGNASALVESGDGVGDGGDGGEKVVTRGVFQRLGLCFGK